MDERGDRECFSGVKVHMHRGAIRLDAEEIVKILAKSVAPVLRMRGISGSGPKVA